MAKKSRLSRKVLQADLEAFAALKTIEDYSPSNPEFSLSNITDSHAAMEASRTDEVQKQNALDAAKDKSVDDEHAFHNKMLGAKTQIKAQYGDNSNEIQSVGIKKKEEYKAGRRAKTKNRD